MSARFHLYLSGTLARSRSCAPSAGARIRAARTITAQAARPDGCVVGRCISVLGCPYRIAVTAWWRGRLGRTAGRTAPDAAEPRPAFRTCSLLDEISAGESAIV